MIELYTLENLIIPYASIPITNGSVTGERNGYYKLSFSILSKYLKEQNISINQKTIFKADGRKYC